MTSIANGFPRFLAHSLVALAACITCAQRAGAAEWAIERSVEARASGTDNINLTPGIHDNVFGWSVSPRATFARRTEVAEIAGTASAGINRYPGNPGLDTDGAAIALNGKLQGERSHYGLSAGFTRDSTLQTELATTGIVQTRTQRNFYTASPSWGYALTERSSMSAGYQYDRARYQAGSGLEDYSNQAASAGYQYLLSERTAATLGGSYSRYETDSASLSMNSYAINAGLSHNTGERLSLGLGIGARHSDTTVTRAALICPYGPVLLCEFFGIPLQSFTATSKYSDRSLLFNASAGYKWETTNAALVASRDINPTGSGLVVQTDRLALSGDHRFGDRLSGSANAAYIVSRYIGGLASDTDYYNLGATLSWKLDEWWSAGAGYNFAYQKVKGAPENATANTVFLSISYNWPKLSMSR